MRTGGTNLTGRIRHAIAKRRLLAFAIACGALIALPALAIAHIERASYWPDPAPDTSVTPPAGGAVPAVRALSTAIDTTQPGDTRVVCVQKLTSTTATAINKNPSIKALDASIASAQKSGYKLRPSQPPIFITKTQGSQLRSTNVSLLEQCQYTSIQDAVTASTNNDRIEILPGTYTEPASRARPTNDPSCAQYKETNDRGDTNGAVSYRYQYHCPNDQNLIAVIGRAPATDANGNEIPPPQPPLEDRHGIPDNGPCLRCNLEIQGT